MTSILILLASLAGWAVAAVALYFVIRLSITAALKSHTRWVDSGKP